MVSVVISENIKSHHMVEAKGNSSRRRRGGKQEAEAPLSIRTLRRLLGAPTHSAHCLRNQL